MPTLTIGALGKKVGLATKTIRFYEEVGLVTPPTRAKNGYRAYTEKSVQELEVICCARNLGLPIEEIKKLLRGCDHGTCHHTQADVQTEIDSYMKLINQKIGQLLFLKQKLDRLKTLLPKQRDQTYCCNILVQVNSLKKGGGTQ